jgi:uncharacterized spore protein YtfJ
MESRTTFVETLAERIGTRFGSTAVFGEPVEAEGVTVIPVARATWGFGGGTGTRPEAEGEGEGGGGGGSTSPVGFIELRDGRASFRPIVDPRPFVLAAAAGLAVGAFAAARRK